MIIDISYISRKRDERARGEERKREAQGLLRLILFLEIFANVKRVCF